MMNARNASWWIGIALVVLIASAFGTSAAAASGAGDAAHFLRDGLGARGRASGSAYVARADDFTASFWNPALTVQSASTVVGGGLEQRNSGLFTFSVLGGWHVAELWSAGAVVVTSDVYDVYHVSGGLRIGSASLGLAMKSYRFGVPGDRGTGLGLDLGARCALTLGGPSVLLAAVSRDVGWTSIRWGTAGTLAVDRTAWVNRVAVAVTVPLAKGEWSIEVDAELSMRRPPEPDESDYWQKTAEANVSLGTAFRWMGVHVRAGIQRFDVLSADGRLRPTVGVGLAVGTLAVDLALAPSALGTTYLGGFQAEL